MSSLSYEDAKLLPGRPLHDRDGHRIGKVSDVYVDILTRQAQWAVVHTGLFGHHESYVPLEGLTFDEHAVVPYTKDAVKGAPNAAPEGELTPEEEDRLYSHYGLGAPPSAELPEATGAGGHAGYRRPSHLVRISRATVVADHRRNAQRGANPSYGPDSTGEDAWARRQF
jgi:sporulation protein YlmC with PRC-barrel domain